MLLGGDEVGAIEDVKEHHAIGDLADPWNLDFPSGAQIDLTDVRKSVGVGEAGAQPRVEEAIHRIGSSVGVSLNLAS
jgi:hypothetical protein